MMKRLTFSLLTLLALAGCSSNSPTENAPPPPPPYRGAPLCTELVSDENPRELFTTALLPAEAVNDAYPFGDTQPNEVQEIINFELGFYIKNEPAYASVALTAPTDLYVETLEISRYDDDHDGIVDRADHGVSYEVCSHVVEGVQQQAVTGNFAHVRTLSPTLMAIVDAERQRILDGVVTLEASALRCDDGLDGVGTCVFFASIKRETEPEFEIVIPEGTAFGTTASPGFDANLRDRRMNGGTGNYFISPNRWGADYGHAIGYRYGACTYEYFAEPYRSAYLARIGANGIYRNDVEVDHPCGLLEADIGAAGTAQGFWMLASKADQYMVPDMSMEEVEDVLSGMLVLNEHFLTPNTHIAMSTHIATLSGGGPQNDQMLVEFARNMPADTNTNVPFDEVEPGITYCYEGHGYMNEAAEFAFLLRVTNEPSPVLEVERRKGDLPCSALSQEERAFSELALTFVR